MKHRHDRFAVVIALAGVIAVAPVFTAAAERQTGATTTQPAPAAPPAPGAAATPKTPAAPPPLPVLTVQIKLKCVVAAGWSGQKGIEVTNSTSGTLPAGQKISWTFFGVQNHERLQPPRRATVFTLQVPLPPKHVITVADGTEVKKLIEIESKKAKGDFTVSCEAFVGG